MMKPLYLMASWMTGLLAALGAGAAVAATVTVSVKDSAGQPAPGVAVILRTATPVPVPAAMPMVEIVQERMRFVPAVAVVTPGTRVRFTNRDNFDHHVKGSGGASFEFRIASASSPTPQRPGEVVLQGGSGPVALGCFLHSVMQGSVYVSESPYHGVTDAEGQVQIAGVPAGDVMVTLWHPQQIVELPSVPARVGADATTLPMALNFVPRRRR
jgi:plastocyanin